MKLGDMVWCSEMSDAGLIIQLDNLCGCLVLFGAMLSWCSKNELEIFDENR